ncbi:MAG: protein-L-isoaspartate O-methyltransferase, partial [Deltaproteobacteria bacterium]|nr:protein-L-isoaspartate O-methyltransferase [Deltaproteobacteria bacterium]
INGRLVIPVGAEDIQELVGITKTDTNIVTERLGGCRFVRLVGKYGFEEGRRRC